MGRRIVQGGRLARYKVNLAHSGVVTDRALEADKPYIHPLPSNSNVGARTLIRRAYYGRSVSDGYRSVGNGVRVAWILAALHWAKGANMHLEDFESHRVRTQIAWRLSAGILGRNSSSDALRVLTNAL